MNELKQVATTSERLREAMRDANKKQIEVANETGLSHSSISRYLSGQMEPKSKAINKLAVVLDVSEMWLWGYDVPRSRTPEQKKTDQLAKLVGRMRREPGFYNIVEMLDQVPADQLDNLGGLIAGLLK